MVVTNSLPKAVQDCHNLMIWVIPLLDNFPRNRRFSLGKRLEDGLIEVLEYLVEAAYTRTKHDLLRRANLRLAVVRHLWRMAHELRTISTQRYAHGAKLLDDLGKQVGGWLKSAGGS